MSAPYYGWAVDAVEGPNWLAEVDEWAFGGSRENLHGRDPKVIDVVHVRWARATAITALDLCGVELAVRWGGHDFWSDRAPVLHEVEARVKKHGDKLPEVAHAWLRGVLDDPDYKSLRSMRDPLTHRFLVRTALIQPTVPSGHQGRTEFDVQYSEESGTRPNARQLILLARDVADRHVRAFPHAFDRGAPPPRP